LLRQHSTRAAKAQEAKPLHPRADFAGRNEQGSFAASACKFECRETRLAWNTLLR
jgi:hypothetical protein